MPSRTSESGKVSVPVSCQCRWSVVRKNINRRIILLGPDHHVCFEQISPAIANVVALTTHDLATFKISLTTDNRH
jgi:hypothetical protein